MVAAAAAVPGGARGNVIKSSSSAFMEGMAELAGGTTENVIDAARYAQKSRQAADIPHDIGSIQDVYLSEDEGYADNELPPCIPIPIEFKDITYDVKVLKEGQVQPNPFIRLLRGMGLAKAGEMENLRVLHGLSGYVPSGKLVALMGASGAGKSTLLNMLSQRAVPSGGTIRYAGVEPPPEGVKKISAFVQQLDLFINNLLVEEQIDTQMALRLPRDTDAKIRAVAKERLISRMNLVKCRNNKIAGPFGIGGISGGEKKRLTVACEVCTTPSILFADEPTTGLDSHMAISIVRVLRGLANNGRTVIATIHQPSSQLFELFTELILLAEGRLLYCGPRDGCVAWFAQLGYMCPSTTNPADFIVKIAAMPEGAEARAKKLETIISWSAKWNAEGEAFVKNWETEGRATFKKQIQDAWERDASEVLRETTHTNNSITLESLRQSAASSFMLDPDDGSPGRVPDPLKGGAALLDDDTLPATQSTPDIHTLFSAKTERPGWWKQFCVLYKRAIMANKRDRMLFHARAAQTFIIGILYTTLSWRLNWSYSGCRSRAGVAYAALLNQSMSGAMGVIHTFGAEKQVIQREYEAGVLSPSAYILAKMAADAPVQLVFPIIFISILHWGTNLRDDFVRFLANAGILLLLANAAMSLGYFASSLSPSPDLAAILINLCNLPITLFGGFMVKVSNTPVFLRWLQYISYVRYGFSNSLAIVFGGNKQVTLPSGELVSGSHWVAQEYDAHTDGGTIALYTILLALILVVMRIATCISFAAVLRRKKENA